MTVSVQTPFKSAVAAGSPTFVYDFRILAAAHLVVRVNGVLQTLGVDYTVTGVGNQTGGTFVMTVTPTVGAVVTAQRKTPYARATDYQTNGDFLATVVNPDIDALWMALQEAQFLSNLAVLLPVGDAGAPMTLPAQAARLNSFLAFDASGNPVTAAGVPGLPTNAFLATFLLAATAAAARTAIGAQVAGSYAASGANSDITSLTGLTSLTSLPPMSVLGGAATRMAIGTGLNANVLAATTPIRLSFPGGIGASGRIDYPGSITADASAFWASLTASSTLYTFYDRNTSTGAITGVFSTLPHIWQDSSSAVSVVNNQHTYVTDTNTMYVGNGTVASVVQRIPEGELVTSGAAVTSVTSYAKMNATRSVVSADVAVPALAGTANFPHNIGVLGVQTTIYARCNTTGGAGTAGQIFSNPGTQSGTAYGHVQARQTSRTSSSVTVGNSSALILIDPSGGGLNAQTAANYTFFTVSQRPF